MSNNPRHLQTSLPVQHCFLRWMENVGLLLREKVSSLPRTIKKSLTGHKTAFFSVAGIALVRPGVLGGCHSSESLPHLKAQLKVRYPLIVEHPNPKVLSACFHIFLL